jgi:hypothetical protein
LRWLLSIIPHELPAPVIKNFHGLIDGVEYDLIAPDGLFPLFTNPFDLRVAEIFEVVVIFCVKVMFSHLKPPPFL